MRVAVVTLYDVRDVNRGSGTYFHLVQELERQGHTVLPITITDARVPLATRLLRRLSGRLGKRYRSYQDPFLGRQVGQITSRRLSKVDCDVVLTNDYAIAGYTSCMPPIILYTDSIFPRNYAANTHPWLENLSAVSVYFCHQTTKRGVSRADRCLIASESGVAELITGYGAAPEKVKHLQYGANLQPPTPEHIECQFEKAVANKSIDMLFVGKDWNIKGGDIAIKTARELRERGIQATLHIVGPKKLLPVKDLDCVTFYGFLDKSSAHDADQLDRLFLMSDVFILPSKAEGLGIVYLEAAAYGTPSLGYLTIGVTTAVRNGESGILLPLTATAVDFADVICSWLENPKSYFRLVQGSRRHYETQGNWQAIVKQLVKELSNVADLSRLN